MLHYFFQPLADAGWREPLDGHTVTASDEAARELLRPEDRRASRSRGARRRLRRGGLDLVARHYRSAVDMRALTLQLRSCRPSQPIPVQGPTASAQC
jgi:hypothetical protein